MTRKAGSEEGLLGVLPRAPKKEGSHQISSGIFVKSREKREIPVMPFSLWQSGLVMPRAVQIPEETESITCPEGLSVSRDKQQRRACLSRHGGTYRPPAGFS